jgi:lysophospholipase L1-like esterase
MRPGKFIASIVVLLALFALKATAYSQSGSDGNAWVGSWAASQQLPEPENALATNDLQDVTIRQIVRLSIGGAALRVHISNAFGSQPLRFTSVHIAHPLSSASPAIDPKSDRALTFSGAAEIIVPAGAEYISDSIDYPVAPLSSVAITFHLDTPPARQTGHPGSRATSYYAPGDLVSSADLPGAKRVDHWYQLSGVDVLAHPSAILGAASIVALGDSITDGHGSTTNGNDRWTDVLAERLQADPSTRSLGVLNQGIGGNHLLIDGLGPNALSRLDRDVLAQTGVRWLIVFEGINDLGGLTRNGEVAAADHSALVDRILSAYQQIVVRAHAHGIRVIGATITPDTGSDYYHPGPANEKDRQIINAWIRAPGHFDDVVDFDQAVRDPRQPDRLSPAFDCGDHLHPDPAGYKAIGNAIPLSLFTK